MDFYIVEHGQILVLVLVFQVFNFCPAHPMVCVQLQGNQYAMQPNLLA